MKITAIAIYRYCIRHDIMPVFQCRYKDFYPLDQLTMIYEWTQDEMMKDLTLGDLIEIKLMIEE